MKTKEQEEQDNFEILLKSAGNDPELLAKCVKELLLRDKTIKAPAKPSGKDKDEEAMREAIADILKKGRRG